MLDAVIEAAGGRKKPDEATDAEDLEAEGQETQEDENQESTEN